MSHLEQLVFVGFNSRVIALHRDSGDIVWDWRSPIGRGCVTLLLDGDRLIVSVQGYTYCLNPLIGQQIWYNQLKGMGSGVTSLASVNGNSMNILAMAAEIATQQTAQAATMINQSTLNS